MLARIHSFGRMGLRGFPVTVEVDMQGGSMPSFDIVGLPDASVRESRERVRAALKNAQISLQQAQRITINLAPADLRKEGPIYDLPIALGLLCAQSRLEAADMESMVILGELSLNGEVRRVRGALPMVIAARALGWKEFLLPAENARECAYLQDITIYPASDLRQIMAHFAGADRIEPLARRAYAAKERPSARSEIDMAQIRGQFAARRALEIAAAGGHNMLMIGPPGSGKTMLARALPGILPPMTFEESLEVTQILSVAGDLAEEGIALHRPFRSPHHTASAVSMVGGGRDAIPGEITRAHHGVLFLDELPEFPRALLEALRQPLEDGEVTIARIGAQVTYPSRFLLLASMNPCPCGHFGSEAQACRCSPNEIRRYMNRVSGPLLDRMDIHVEVSALPIDDLIVKGAAEESAKVRERVCAARERQWARYDGTAFSNATLNQKQVEEYCLPGSAGQQLLSEAVSHYGFSARTYMRLLKVARTIADLAGEEAIGEAQVAEAIQYRALDKKYWQG